MIESIIETPRPSSAPGMRQQQTQLQVDCSQPYLPRSRATAGPKCSEPCCCASDQSNGCDHRRWVIVQENHQENKQQETTTIDQQYDQHLDSEDSQDHDDQEDMEVASPSRRSPRNNLRPSSRSFAESETAEFYVLGFATASAQVKRDSLVFSVRDRSRLEDLRSVIDSLRRSKLWDERSAWGACGYDGHIYEQRSTSGTIIYEAQIHNWQIVRTIAHHRFMHRAPSYEFDGYHLEYCIREYWRGYIEAAGAIDVAKPELTIQLTPALMPAFRNLLLPLETSLITNKYRVHLLGKDAYNFLGLFYRGFDPSTSALPGGKTFPLLYKIIGSSRQQFGSVQVHRLEPTAVLPFKQHASSPMYHLSLTGVHTRISDDQLICSTGLRFTPPFGFHVEIIAAPQLYSLGYRMIQETIVVDPSSTEEILIPLLRLGSRTASLPDFPFAACYLMVRRSNPGIEFIESSYSPSSLST